MNMYSKKTSYEQYQEFIEQVADNFLKALEKDNLKWTKSWSAGEIQADRPHNPLSGKPYRGFNSLVLDLEKEEKGYNSHVWLTYNQIQELGGRIEKGTKSTAICYYNNYKTVEKTDQESGEITKEVIKLEKPIFKKYNVFNLAQTKGIDYDKIQQLQERGMELRDFNNNEICEAILSNVDVPIEHHLGSDRAYYSPNDDKIHLPAREQFKSDESYYSVAFHELGHATGHEKRLNRDLSGTFGTESYAREELRAELYSYLQAKELGIAYDLENHQSYVKSWTKNLQDNKYEMIEAVSDAMKIVRYVNDKYIDQENVKAIELQQKKESNEVDLKLGVEIQNAINRSFTKSKQNVDQEQKLKDWELLKENKTLAIGVLKTWHNESLEYIKDKSHPEAYIELSEDEIKELNNEKLDIEGYKQVWESLEKEKGELSTLQTKTNQPQQQQKQYDINYVEIPLHELLQRAGFNIVREGTTQHYVRMKDGTDTIVVQRGKNDGNYLYWNTDRSKKDNSGLVDAKGKVIGDTGTVFTFCKIRGINVHELVRNADLKDIKHTLEIPNSQSYNPQVTDTFMSLKLYNETKNNSLTTIRGISPSIIKNFNKSIRVDDYGNVVFPSFTMEGVNHQTETINIQKTPTITLSGLNKKLLLKPITHDRNGVAYDKPINSLDQGKSGLTYFKKDEADQLKITTAIASENAIDSMSYAELKKIDLDKTLIVSFNGSMKENAIETFERVMKVYPKIDKVIGAYDNDKQGYEYDLKTKEILSKVNKDNDRSIYYEIDKSSLKDWNEQLIDQKKDFMKLPSINRNHTREKEGELAHEK